MSHVRRIAQGLLVAFTVSTALPPVPAWALRQGAAAQSEETTAGLEEGLTGKPTTMNRREFLKRGAAVVGAAAVGGGVGATAAEALMRTAVAPAGTAIHRPLAIPVIASGPFTDSLVTTEQLGPSPSIRFEWTMPLRPQGEKQADGTMAYPRRYRADGSLGPMVYAEGHRHFDLALAFPIDGGGRIVRAQDYDAYPALARGVPVSVRLRFRGFEGIDFLGIGEERYGPEVLRRGIEVEMALGQFTRAEDVRIPVSVGYTETHDPNKTEIQFAFTALPDGYTFQDRSVDAHRTLAVGGAALVGAAVAGGAAALALAPADAEKVLAEQLSTIVGTVKMLTIGQEMTRPTGKLLVLVDSEIADPSAVRQSAFEGIPGYPDVAVGPLSLKEAYLSQYPDRFTITLLARETPISESASALDTIYVKGLNGQRVGHLLPVVVTEALAQYRLGNRAFDMTPYWAVRNLTADQVWQVLSSQFA